MRGSTGGRWSAVRSPAGPWTGRAAAALALGVLLAVPGCYAPQLVMLKSGLDSLRVQVDTLAVRDSVSMRVIAGIRHDLSEQRDILLSTRASSGSTSQEQTALISRLEARLDEVMTRLDQFQRPAGPASPAPGAPDPNQLYDQASQDLTQGRYPLALGEFREYVEHFPASDLADNAQYGVGECYYAESKFDSAAVEYQKVIQQSPQGDKVPASLWKLALCQEKLGQAGPARKTMEDLVKRYPLSGEAQLARDHLGAAKHR